MENGIELAIKAAIEAMRLEDPLFDPDNFDFKVEIVEADAALEHRTPLIEWCDGSKIWKDPHISNDKVGDSR